MSRVRAYTAIRPRAGSGKRIGRSNRRGILRVLAGFLFLGLGVAGLFLPVLQGFLFLAVGIVLLADHIPWFATLRDRIYRRFPRSRRVVRRIRARIHILAGVTRRRHGIRPKVRHRR